MTNEEIQREPGEMTPDQQLEEWVKGNSIHNNNRWSSVVDENDKIIRREKMEGGECCPDFSCCEPRLQWSQEVRETFMRSDEKTRQEMMFMSLGKAMELASSEQEEKVEVYIAGSIPPEGMTQN